MRTDTRAEIIVVGESEEEWTELGTEGETENGTETEAHRDAMRDETTEIDHRGGIETYLRTEGGVLEVDEVGEAIEMDLVEHPIEENDQRARPLRPRRKSLHQT